MWLSEESGGTGAPRGTPLSEEATRRKGAPTRMLRLLVQAGGTRSGDALASRPACRGWLVGAVTESLVLVQLPFLPPLP